MGFGVSVCVLRTQFRDDHDPASLCAMRCRACDLNVEKKLSPLKWLLFSSSSSSPTAQTSYKIICIKTIYRYRCASNFFIRSSSPIESDAHSPHIGFSHSHSDGRTRHITVNPFDIMLHASDCRCKCCLVFAFKSRPEFLREMWFDGTKLFLIAAPFGWLQRWESAKLGREKPKKNKLNSETNKISRDDDEHKCATNE